MLLEHYHTRDISDAFASELYRGDSFLAASRPDQLCPPLPRWHRVLIAIARRAATPRVWHRLPDTKKTRFLGWPRRPLSSSLFLPAFLCFSVENSMVTWLKRANFSLNVRLRPLDRFECGLLCRVRNAPNKYTPRTPVRQTSTSGALRVLREPYIREIRYFAIHAKKGNKKR